MRRIPIAMVACAALTAPWRPAELAARVPITITLASPAPDGSVWDLELKQMGSDWQRVSNGAVRLKVFPEGRIGEECSVVTQLRRGVRPQAAALTTGLGCVDRAFSVFSVPFLFDSVEEVRAVTSVLEPTLRARLGAQGLTLISWGFGGWVHVFSTEKITSLADLRRARLFTGAGDSTAENWYRRNGFHPVVLSHIDARGALASGAVTAIPVPPYAALALQWFRETPHMLDLPIAPLVGAIVVNTATWNEIPTGLRPGLLDAARAMEARLQARIPAQDQESVREMAARSLKVWQPDAGFQAESAPLIDSMRDAWVPAEIYDLAIKARSAYRDRSPR